MNDATRQTTSLKIYSIIGFFFFFCFYFFPSDPKFLSYLLNGKEILFHQTLQPFSHYHAHEWYDPFWLVEIFLFCLASIPGLSPFFAERLPAIAIWTYLTVQLISFFIPKDSLSVKSLVMNAAALLLTCLPFLYFSLIGLEYWTFLFIFLMWRAVRENTSWYWLLLLQVLWANSHPSFLLAPVCYLVFASWRFFSAFSWLHLLVVCLASLFQPYLHWGVLFYAPLYYWQFMPSQQIILYAPFYLIAFSFLGIYQTQSKRQFVVFCIFSLWFIGALIFPVMFLAALVLVVFYGRKHLLRWQCVCGLGLVLLFFPMWLSFSPYKTSSVDLEKAGHFLAQTVAEKSPRVLHTPSTAGFIGWYGKVKPTVSGWVPHADEDFVQKLEVVYQNPARWSDFSRDYKINVVALSHQELSQRLVFWLGRQVGWSLVYCDQSIAILVENSAELAEIAKQYGIEDQKELIDTQMSSQAQNFYLRSEVLLAFGLPQRAAADWEKAKILQKNVAWDRYLQGRFDLLEDKTKSAMEHFHFAFREGKLHNALLFLMQHLMQEGSGSSLSEAENLIREIPNSVDKEFWLAQLQYLKGNKQAAAEKLKDIIRSAPEYEKARFYLQLVEQEIAELSITETVTNARLLIANEKYHEARELLQAALRNEPDSLEIYAELGQVALMEEKLDLTIRYARKVLEEIPEHVAANCQMARALAKQGKWLSSLQIMDRFAVNYPDEYDVRQALEVVDKIATDAMIRENQFVKLQRCLLFARIMSRRKQFVPAIEILEKISLASEKEQQKLRNVISLLYFQSGQDLIYQNKVALGYKHLEKSTEINPKSFEPQLMIATMELKKRNWEEARKRFEQLVAMAPADPRGRLGIALIDLGKGLRLQLAGEFGKALEHFESYLAKTPDDEDKPRIERFIQNLEKQKAQAEENHKWKIQKGLDQARALFEKGKYPEARKILKELLIAEPDMAEVSFNLGITYFAENKWFEAKNAFAHTLRLNASYSTAHYFLGETYYQAGRMDFAEIHLKMYLKTGDESYKEQVEKRLRVIELLK